MAPQPAGPPRQHSAVPDPRRAALTALGAVEHGRVRLEDALDQVPGHDRMETRDRAFARNLAATTLRRAGEIGAVIDARLERPLPESARAARHILMLGIAQLLFLKTPAHAAVATSVALADAVRLPRFKGLINAVLRRAARDGADSLAGIDAARVNTPDALWRSWCAAYGEATAHAIATAHLTEAPLDLTPRDGADAQALAGDLAADLLPTGSLRLRDAAPVAALPGYAEGRWWVQDAAAALPARLLGRIDGRRVLDLCAAPGGKTLQLCAAGAEVTAVDRSAARLETVRTNLRRAQLAAATVEADGATFDAEPFDAVLLDAPCSATGTMRRHPDIARGKGPDDAARLAPLQTALLENAARLTRPGGILVYAVCSLQPEEGEGRIEAFLARHPGFARQPVTADEIGGLSEGLNAAGDLRTLPSMWMARGGMDGFYAARLRRLDKGVT